MAFIPPLGNTSPEVLLDNATRLDNLLNSLALVFPDREGVDLDTWRGIMVKVAAAIIEAQNSITAIGLPFTTLAEAQAAADDGKIPVGAVTWVRNPSDASLADEYINNGGTVEPTGRTMPSQEAVSEAAKSASKAGLTADQNIYDDDGVLLVHALADANGVAPLTINKLGAVGLANAQIESVPDVTEAHWGVTDKNGVPYIYGTPMGGVGIGNTEIVEIPGPPGIVFCDANYIPMACTPGYTSNQAIPVIGGSGPVIKPVIRIRITDWIGFRSDGQSLSLGQMPPASAAANPPVSTTQPYGNLGFSTNNNTFSSSTDTAIPLVERAYTPTDATYPAGESPCSGAANSLIERMCASAGVEWGALGTVVFASSPGRGGTPISGLSKGTVPYQRALDHVTNSVRLANDAGKTFSELAIAWTQGESDYAEGTSRDVYLSALTKYISDITDDTVAITGQQYSPIFVSYQLASHRAYAKDVPVIALALRDAAHNGVSRLSHPMYFGSYVDNIHCTNYTYLMFAKYYGRAIYKLLDDNQNGREPGMHWLNKTGEFRQGNIVELYFNVPSPPLVFDTEWVAQAVNYGFDVRDAANNYSVSDVITSVAIAGPDRVRIICSRPLTDTEQITYAWGRPGDAGATGRNTGPRGNLRDSEGDLPGESYTDGAGTLRKLHNWCVIF